LCSSVQLRGWSFNLSKEATKMALRACVDCGTQLGHKAEFCPNCHSEDPYGNQRETEKLVIFVLGLLVLIFGMSWFLFQVLPFQVIMKFWQLWK
jgi:ribosomal protein L40E